jgi:F420-non-reducing hydrogenase large subunit
MKRMKRITIDPITRLEGHGKIEIFLSDEGNVDNVYFQVPELRGFEKFCEGRPVEELSQIVTKICGVCPGCHHMASGKAADAVYGVSPPPAARKIRELFYMAHFVHSHIAHFYALAAPDFVVGPDAPKAERNILGLIAKVGKEIGTEVIKQRRIAQEIQALLGGTKRMWYSMCPGECERAFPKNKEPISKKKSKGSWNSGSFP